MKRTTIIDDGGDQLASFSDDLSQITVGQSDFYLGQTNYEVLEVTITPEGERIVTVRERNE